ncbi:MAG: undecaprenyl/decaprenyl-phosphate alpha-N-acetylglucosaminyl 1-phosphate transferase [Pseudomonadales bacterium]|nr:undecaprenyl/decaprenyl-phosphate alpha-N-acetylglucosaminyl 1-phosphate transferase [Pseudomonadales bacterium]
MTLLLSFAMALFLTMVLMPLVMRYGSRLGLIDVPTGGRKMHTIAVPRVGGVAIFVGVALALLFSFSTPGNFLVFFAAATLVAAFGLADDVFDLHFSYKFLGQFIAAGWFVYAFGGFVLLPFFGLEPAPVWLASLFSVVFIVGITNAVNLSDGLDGLAAGNSLLSLVLLAYLALQAQDAATALIAITIAGGLLGFLRTNTHPAEVFMGDSGSQFLGFSIACITLLILHNDTSAYSPALPLMILGLPILDTFSVMAVRYFFKRPMFKADKSHIHHQLLRMGFKHYEVVSVLYALQLVFVLMAYRLRYAEDDMLILVYLGFCTLVLACILAGRLSGWMLHSNKAAEATENHRNIWLRKLSWIYPHTDSIIAALLAMFLVSGALIVSWDQMKIDLFSVATVASMLTLWILIKDKYDWVSRIIVVIGCVFVLAGFLMDEGLTRNVSTLLNMYLLALAFSLVVAIRLTRKEHFRLDNQDFLVLGLILVLPQLPLEGVNASLMARGTLSLAILLYAVEFILGRASKPRSWLNMASLVSILLVGSSLQSV